MRVQTWTREQPAITDGLEWLTALVDDGVESILGQLIPADRLSTEAGCGLIGRYTVVLEGNFVTWLTATYLRAKSKEASAIIKANLLEEIGDDHPSMLRRFAIQAGSSPESADYLSVSPALYKVREYFSTHSGFDLIAVMLFYESFIANFMSYLAQVANHQGSSELTYTDVHGLLDVEHSKEMLTAALLEQSAAPLLVNEDSVKKGIVLLTALIKSITRPDLAISLE
jgi:hypothetical protein